jgi:hypothetical protein
LPIKMQAYFINISRVNLSLCVKQNKEKMAKRE